MKRVGLVLASVFCILGLYCWMRTGDAFAILRAINGQQLFSINSSVDLGELGNAKRAKCQIEFVNLGWKRCSIVGARRSCGCITTSELPMSIDPFGKGVVMVNVSTLRNGGPFEHSIDFFTSDSKVGTLNFKVKGVTILSSNSD